jgi:chorismate--pyruvate lyase
MNLFRHFREPAWHDPHQPSSRVPPARLRSWLLDGSSLTLRLQALCREGFRVEVVSERSERPQLSEAAQLSISPHHLARVREVFLCCGDKRWVFARTVIPFDTLTGPNRRLARLGSRPLGAFLFAQPGVERGPLQVSWMAPSRKIGQSGIFGRRSRFLLRGRPLLVSEFFLPEFLESIDS